MNIQKNARLTPLRREEMAFATWDGMLAAPARLEHCTFVPSDVVFDAILHERVG
jgi:hypothetical protein